MFARRIGGGACAAAAVMLAAAPAPAFHYSAYLGTTVYGYDTAAEAGGELAQAAADTYVPLQFRVDQDTAGGNVGFVASSRLYKDVGGDGDVNGRVYYGYLRWRPLEGLEAEVGRQYVAAGVTAATLDGARAIIRGGNKWRADLYGGSNVIPDYGPMRRFSRPSLDGELYDPTDRGYWLDNYTYGAHAGTNVKELWSGMVFPAWVGVGGAISEKGGHRSDTTLGFDAVEDVRPNLKTSQEVRYDLIGLRVNYQYYSARYRPWETLRTYVDYRWQEPRFDYASIFSVFAREARHRGRVGGQYKISEIIQPFADYSLSKRRGNLGHLARAGLDQNFSFVFLHYGALYGVGNRDLSGGDEVGAFAAAEFPKPLLPLERLSAGAAVDYLRYKGYDTPAPVWEDVLLFDLHGRLKIWRTFETTLGTETLTNPDRRYEFRAYLEASASISG